MIDFLASSRTRDDMIAMALEHGFLVETAEGFESAPGVDFDPSPGTPAAETGIAVAPPEDWTEEWLPEFHFNIRCSGAVEADQIDGIEQYDKGELLPLRQRTKWGQAMSLNGLPYTGPNGRTSGVTHQSVTFIDPESVATQQRVWQ